MSREPSPPPGLRSGLRIVLDTNVIISGMIAPSGAPAAVLRAWLTHRFVLVTAPALIDEFTNVARRPRLQKYGLTAERVREMAFLLWARSVVTPGNLEIEVIADDPDDNKFLACALEGRAQYVVSGDRHLLSVQEYQGVHIVTPDTLLRMLDLGGATVAT